MSTAALRRLKKQKAKAKQQDQDTKTYSFINEEPTNEQVEVEYVPEEVNLEGLPEELKAAFQKFIFGPERKENKLFNHTEEDQGEAEMEFYTDSDDFEMPNVRLALEQAADALDQKEQAQEAAEGSKISRKQLKKLTRTSLATLKSMARRPEVVEWEDVTAPDPAFLVHLKCVRSTVPVPKHWSRKRRYLTGKRGFVKPPFELPSFIRDTGIGEVRATQVPDSVKTIKLRARERLRPKMLSGSALIDYQKFHDAFFKHQTKPPLTTHGDLYFEGKEFAVRYKDKRPGFLSDLARQALGMGPLSCPPWLYAQQKYGAPPSYPHLRIPGLNAPIPEGASWGYHAGGWGKPPIASDEKPVILEDSAAEREMAQRAARFWSPVEYGLWGEFEPGEEQQQDVQDDDGMQGADETEDEIDGHE